MKVIVDAAPDVTTTYPHLIRNVSSGTIALRLSIDQAVALDAQGYLKKGELFEFNKHCTPNWEKFNGSITLSNDG
jgi:hypothetical protein